MFRRTIRYVFLRRRLPIILLIFIGIFTILTTSIITQKHNSSISTTVDRTLILIRTSYRCQSRLDYLLQSWIPPNDAEQSNIYLLTDKIAKYANKTVLDPFKNVIETNCPETHTTFDLCCKTALEFELYYNLTQRNFDFDWMCRFDDDQYVNLRNLYQFLSQINPSKPYYIGRTSIKYRLKAPKHNRTYAFATYGAGVCFSRTLLYQLRPHVNKTILPHNCVKRGISDDAYIGYSIELILNVSLTPLQDLFHSHLEKLDVSFRSFTIQQLQNAITFGFAWDRYKLAWLPIIHQLIELIDNGDEVSANRVWLFLRNYEKEHPENLDKQRDQSCIPHQLQSKPA